MIVGFLALSLSAPTAMAQSEPYGVWLQTFSEKARAAGIEQELLDATFKNITVDDYVIELDRRQPEDKLSYSKYLKNTVNPRRIAKGQALLREHRVLLAQIEATYGVEPRFIIALWGMETDYGANTGNFMVVQSLATLAYEGRRRELFEKELLAALTILQQGPWNQFDLIGSWAGAMGNCQFMPSSYLKFAVDWDKDGTRDIWHSLPDTFASIANYLSQSGWQKDIGWGVKSSGEGAIFPGTAAEGGVIVTPNFEVLLKWNRSRYFASAVGQLADAIGKAE